MPLPSEQAHKVDFFYEEVTFILQDTAGVNNWLLDVFKQEKKRIGAISFIFCLDSYLHQLNIQYLNHDTLTDVITFPYSSSNVQIDGDIFISIERVLENAQLFNVPFRSELLRVIIHGSLHLLGYKDKTLEEQQLMRQKEDFYLIQYPNL